MYGSQKHIPSFINNAEEIKNKGVSDIIVISGLSNILVRFYRSFLQIVISNWISSMLMRRAIVYLVCLTLSSFRFFVSEFA